MPATTAGQQMDISQANSHRHACKSACKSAGPPHAPSCPFTTFTPDTPATPHTLAARSTGTPSEEKAAPNTKKV